MKLKKIASLALAGVMAVSMLAGCANKDNSSSNGTTAPTTTSVVNAVNNGQDASNKVKVTFTDNALVDSALKKAVELAFSTTSTDVSANFTNVSGIKIVTIANDPTNWAVDGKSLLVSDGNGYMTSANIATITDPTKSYKVADGNVYTYVEVGSLTALNAEAAEKMVAGKVDTFLSNSKLGYSTYDAQKDDANGIKAGDKYLNYTYDGNVALTSYTEGNGTTTYYYAVVINQTVAVEEMPKA